MAVKIIPSIFREYDIRGIAGRDLSPEFAECLGRAYAMYISGRTPVAGRKRLTVAAGRDCRLSSDDYAEALIRGMRAGGLDVVNLGVCPTPLTYFGIFHLDLDGGIMVTGSHNPGDYNGFKTCVGRDTIHGHQIQELRAIMEGELRDAPKTGSVKPQPVIAAYTDHLVKNARP